MGFGIFYFGGLGFYDFWILDFRILGLLFSFDFRTFVVFWLFWIYRAVDGGAWILRRASRGYNELRVSRRLRSRAHVRITEAPVPGFRFQRLTGVRTGRLTLRWARCWPRLTPALGQVLE